MVPVKLNYPIQGIKSARTDVEATATANVKDHHQIKAKANPAKRRSAIARKDHHKDHVVIETSALVLQETALTVHRPHPALDERKETAGKEETVIVNGRITVNNHVRGHRKEERQDLLKIMKGENKAVQISLDPTGETVSEGPGMGKIRMGRINLLSLDRNEWN